LRRVGANVKHALLAFVDAPLDDESEQFEQRKDGDIRDRPDARGQSERALDAL